MTVDVKTGLHIPANPNRFSFDAEVAAIFDNMAARSLPGYQHVYDRITEIVKRMDIAPYSQVWDFGVSTGAGLMSVRRGAKSAFLDYNGADISQPMLDQTAKKCPWAVLHHHDFEEGLPPAVEKGNVAVAIFGWTLQFLESVELRHRLLRETYEALKPGGILFVLEKWAPRAQPMGSVLDEAYYDWRRDNGYTLAEIKAKSTALTNAMWPWSREALGEALLRAGFRADAVTDLYRLYTFGGVAAIK